MTYRGKPLFEENFPPAFDTTAKMYEKIMPCRVVRVNENYEITTSAGGGQYGVTLEQDGASGQSIAMVAITNGQSSDLAGSLVEVAVIMAGTALVSCAGPVKRGDYLKATNTGQVVAIPSGGDLETAVGQAKEDGAIGNRILMRFNGMSAKTTVIS